MKKIWNKLDTAFRRQSYNTRLLIAVAIIPVWGVVAVALLWVIVSIVTAL